MLTGTTLLAQCNVEALVGLARTCRHLGFGVPRHPDLGREAIEIALKLVPKHTILNASKACCAPR
jgi:hypothetical protein